MTLHAGKTRIVHVRHGFEFLGYKIKRGSRPLRLSADKIKSGVRGGALYAFPRDKSIRHFKDQIRRRTRCKAPVTAALSNLPIFWQFSVLQRKRGWCPGAESNSRHRDFQSRALPTELPGHRRAAPNIGVRLALSSPPIDVTDWASDRRRRRRVRRLPRAPPRRAGRPRVRHRSPRTSGQDRHRRSGASKMDGSARHLAGRKSGRHSFADPAAGA